MQRNNPKPYITEIWILIFLATVAIGCNFHEIFFKDEPNVFEDMFESQ